MNVDNNQSVTPWSSYTDGTNETGEVEQTQTPEELQAEVDKLNEEINRLIQEAADMLDKSDNTVGENGEVKYPPGFVDKYQEIASKYEERALKQRELDKANGVETAEPPEQEPILQQILNAMENEDKKTQLGDAIGDILQQIDEIWQKIRDSINSAIIANISGGGGGSKSSSSDNSSSTTRPIDLPSQVKKTEPAIIEEGDSEDVEGDPEVGNTDPQTETDLPNNNT